MKYYKLILNDKDILFNGLVRELIDVLYKNTAKDKMLMINTIDSIVKRLKLLRIEE